MFSSTSSGSSKPLGDSSNQGRKSDEVFKRRGINLDKEFAELNDSDNAQVKDDDAEIKGRNIDFGDMDADADFGFDDTVGTTQIVTDAEVVTATQNVPTASENVPTATQDVTTAEEEVSRKREIKGKAVVT